MSNKNGLIHPFIVDMDKGEYEPVILDNALDRTKSEQNSMTTR